MFVAKEYSTGPAQSLLKNSELAAQAYTEVIEAIRSISDHNQEKFTINNTIKHGNGVVPIKEKCYIKLEREFLWYREKPLSFLKDKMRKGGPIDVYKEFSLPQEELKVGLEFETGNISSAHRPLNKLAIGMKHKELNLAILLIPIKGLSFYLTDRVSNYEELEPYFCLFDDYPLIILGFDAEVYSANAPFLPKGNDGQSKRSKRTWSKRK